MEENREVAKINRREFIKKGIRGVVGATLLSNTLGKTEKAEAFFRMDYTAWGTQAKDMAEWVREFSLSDPYGMWEFYFIPADLKVGEGFAKGARIIYKFPSCAVSRHFTEELIRLDIDIGHHEDLAIKEKEHSDGGKTCESRYLVTTNDNVSETISYQENKETDGEEKEGLDLQTWGKNDRWHAALVNRFVASGIYSQRKPGNILTTSVLEFSIDNAHRDPQLKHFEAVNYDLKSSNYLPVIYCHDFNIARKPKIPLRTTYCIPFKTSSAKREISVLAMHELSKAVRLRKLRTLWLVKGHGGEDISINHKNGELIAGRLRTEKESNILGRKIGEDDPIFVDISEKIKKYFHVGTTINVL